MTSNRDLQPPPDYPFGLDDERVARCLEGRASADDVNAVEARLLSDARFRAEWLRLISLEGFLREQCRDETAGSEVTPRRFPTTSSSIAALPAEAVAPRGSALLPWSGLLMAFAVAMVSVAVTSVAAAVIGRGSSWSRVLVNDGFEPGTAVNVTGLPAGEGAWTGDFARIVKATDSVTPVEGVGMLQLLQGDYQGKPIARGFSSNQHRLVDLRPYRDRLARGLVTLEFSAAFNRGAAAPDAPADTGDQCSVGLFALTSAMVNDARLSEPGQLRDLSLAYAHCRHLDLDDDPQTWQPTVTELRLPPDTDFVLMHVGVNEYPPLKRDGPTMFPAHFCDDARATLYERSGAP
jgi:hypothetical protein